MANSGHHSRPSLPSVLSHPLPVSFPPEPKPSPRLFSWSVFTIIIFFRQITITPVFLWSITDHLTLLSWRWAWKQSPCVTIFISLPLDRSPLRLLWSWSSGATSVPLRPPIGSASSWTDRYHHHHLPFLAELSSSFWCWRLLVQGLNGVAMGRCLLAASTLGSQRHSPCSLSGESQAAPKLVIFCIVWLISVLFSLARLVPNDFYFGCWIWVWLGWMLCSELGSLLISWS